MLELKGLFPKRRRSSLGPTCYVPRCKCGKPLEQREKKIRHVGTCEDCQEKFLEALRSA